MFTTNSFYFVDKKRVFNVFFKVYSQRLLHSWLERKAQQASTSVDKKIAAGVAVTAAVVVVVVSFVAVIARNAALTL